VNHPPEVETPEDAGTVGGVDAAGAAGAAAPRAALADALGRVGDRWSLLVIAALLGGPRRFGDLLGALDGLAPNILSRRLAHLEAEGLVVGEPYSRRPLRHAYRLTEPGADLAGVLRLLADWEAHRGGAPAPDATAARHGTCGTALEARWYCPTCDEPVDDPGADGLRWM
jgi:DNA-binding HxlR family transcriptional regulator